MATDLKCATVIGSGTLLDVATSTTIGECRIRTIVANVSGRGAFVIESTNAMGKVSRIKFWATNSENIQLNENGVRMFGTEVSVVAPVSDAQLTVFYG